ncbi:DUF2726 domain-containing protein [Thermosipho ferrireducens]|uniref:DUF2726 domain-containing protein n=1 Tax=Thermosipho ferrireducens TaxID=2571116 RepID=A0ABX7S511_9BACT|nr:DUF2726 domain-containing protein [Thermosipho ferrireducens]QTA37579.1 DUF2726 domain-containing protein [Thermosipho ferrireducens]
MGLKKSIFDSYSEKKLFEHIDSIWKDKLIIYPQLPFTKIFDIKKLNVDQKERNFLLKTNIDYTICDKNYKPLMCIEFDGIGRGYSKEGKYIQLKKDLKRKKRKWKLELKLKIAREHCFPLYIISYEEVEYISEEIHLAVIDGIIGQTIANMQIPIKIGEYLKDNQDILSSMGEYERNEFIQDLVISAEVEQELTWDPIAKKAAEIGNILFTNGITNNYGYRFLSKPELPNKRINSYNRIEWIGCEAWCETPKGKITSKVWIRNFEGILVSPLSIVKNIAELSVYYKTAIKNGVKILK